MEPSSPPPSSRRERRPSRQAALRRLADEVLEVPDLDSLNHLLTDVLAGLLDVPSVTLHLWDRKLDRFEVLHPGETRTRPIRPGEPGATAPEAHYLIADGCLIDTPGKGEGVLLPLMARSGLVGMMVIAPRPKREAVPYRPAEVRLLSALASRAALALENSLYQRELIASERMAALGTMAGMLAHDFRGPMTVIRGYAETLLAPDLKPAELSSRAGLIIDMIDRLDRMTNETLDFARGGGRLARRTLGLEEMLGELAEDLAHELPGLEVQRDFQLPTKTQAALDVDKLRRVVGNIAANARDAMGGRGRLHLIARIEARAVSGNGGGDPRWLVLVIADEGPGVPEEIRARVFDPFVTRGKKGGTGLGLAVARRFIEDHGGTIDLLSEGPGARFKIALPLGADAETPRAAE